jgi:hypothetical protein
MQGILYFIENILGANASDMIYFMIFNLLEKNDNVLFYNSIYNNLFIDIEKKQRLIKIFFQAARCRKLIRKLVRYWRWRKTPLIEIKRDMYGNDLSVFPTCQKIVLIENAKKYPFRLTDLATFWHKSLLHSQNFFCRPRNLTNPYTGREFELHNLYNIYFTLQSSTFHIRPLLSELFIVNFDLEQFRIVNYPKLQDLAIRDYEKKVLEEERFDDIIQMLATYGRLHIIAIGSNIVSEKRQLVIKTYGHFLISYYYAEYSQNSLVKNLHKNKLTLLLPTFVSNNSFDWEALTANLSIFT